MTQKKLLFVALSMLSLNSFGQSATFDVDVPGNLATLVGEQKYEITNLTVKGDINGTDIRALRDMMGISLSGSPSKGKVETLDLSDANIVAGGDYYMYDFNTYENFFTQDNKLGKYVFFSCPAIKDITIPKTVVEIGQSAFTACANLANIHTPAENTHFHSVDGVLFCDSDARLVKYPQARTATQYTVPEGTKIIGYESLSDNLSLTRINLPEGLTTIERVAFCFTKNVPTIDIPSTVSSVGYSAFNYCSGLSNINVAASNPYLASEDGVLMNKTKTEIVRCPLAKKGSYVVPETVTQLRDYAFSSCDDLTSITLSENLDTICDWALDGCSGISELTIPVTVRKIGKGAFNGCSKITSATVPDGVENIEEWLFADCKALASVQFPSSIKTLKKGAFMSCSSLTEFSVPEQVSEIGVQAFYGCLKLKKLTIPAAMGTIQQFAFMNCEALEEIYVYAQTPPACMVYPFFGVKKETCKLYVPSGTMADYKNATEWKDFLIIEEMPPTGITASQIDEGKEIVSYYSVDGKRLEAPAKGVNIVKMSDGSTRKLLVK